MAADAPPTDHLSVLTAGLGAGCVCCCHPVGTLPNRVSLGRPGIETAATSVGNGAGSKVEISSPASGQSPDTKAKVEVIELIDDDDDGEAVRGRPSQLHWKELTELEREMALFEEEQEREEAAAAAVKAKAMAGKGGPSSGVASRSNAGGDLAPGQLIASERLPQQPQGGLSTASECPICKEEIKGKVEVGSTTVKITRGLIRVHPIAGRGIPAYGASP